MSQESFVSGATYTTATASASASTPTHESSQSSVIDYSNKIQSAIQSLSSITTIPPSVLSSSDPAFSLLHDADVSSQISTLLRHPDSGAGDNNLCRWFYDTFQSSCPPLQLVVLRFLPIITGLYLSRIPLRKPLAGFEAILLALHAYETTSRNGQAITVTIPDLSNSSVYHETKELSKNNATDLNLAVISPSLEPYGTVRSTRRARIVGVALELYFNKISAMPLGSKVDFCEYCGIWSGQDDDMYNINKESCRNEEEEEGQGKKWEDKQQEEEEEEEEGEGKKEKEEGKRKKEEEEGRIHLSWELLQPVLRILSHCLLGSDKKEHKLFDAACEASRRLYARAMYDINPKAILATSSLVRLSKMAMDPDTNEIDYTEIKMTNVISL